MADGSFDVNWADTPLVPQATGMSCWAASAAMVVAWRDRMSVDPQQIASGAGEWAAYANGLNPADVPTLAQAWNLTTEPPQSYTVDALRQMIQDSGPLWVGAKVPGLHVIVVTGLYGDGTPDGTFVRINDPWGRDPGTPGAPGAYDANPGRASQYIPTLTQFIEEYEAAAEDSRVNIQILHANGRS
jgi:hypothetical protein